MTPLMLSTWSFGLRGHAEAWPMLRDGGPAIDAAETACRVVEADPEVDSVGLGGLPDRDGDMTLDAAVMLDPVRCGAVAGVRRRPHPVSIARRVMEVEEHVLLVGTGAERFADEQGFAEGELLTDAARDRWTQWRADPKVVDQSGDSGLGAGRPIDTGAGGQLFADPDEARWKNHDTIGTLVLDAHGTLAGACSTSGTPFKTPGRVGDSPIIGHGLYVDPAAGAAVATGTGELVMGVCGAFLAVELLRGGADAETACRVVLERIAATYTLRDDHQVGLLVLRPDGGWAGMSLRKGFRVSVTGADRDESVAAPCLATLDTP